MFVKRNGITLKMSSFLNLYMKQCPLVLHVRCLKGCSQSIFWLTMESTLLQLLLLREWGSLPCHSQDNSAAHDTHNVGVETDDAMDCRCSVRMGYPFRHMFAVSEACHLKVVLGSMNTRFYTNQESIDMMQGNLKKLALTVALVKNKK